MVFIHCVFAPFIVQGIELLPVTGSAALLVDLNIS